MAFITRLGDRVGGTLNLVDKGPMLWLRRRASRWVEEETVAIRLRELREAEGVTQEELARRVEVAQTQVSRTEHRGNPHVDTLRRYLEALGYELECVAVKKNKRVPIAL